MIPKVLRAFCIVLLLLVSQAPVAWSSYVPEALPLPQAIGKADIIVLAELENFTVDPTYQAPPKDKSLMGMQALITMTSLNPPGEATFHVIKTLKGQADGTTKIELPQILSYYYADARLPVQNHIIVLLMLKKVGDLLQVVDPNVPIIMLAFAEKPFSTTTSSTDVATNVYELVFRSADDPLLRMANLYLLRTAKHPFVSKSLLEYMDDANFSVRDSALYGLALNQQLVAIEKIARMEEVAEETGRGIYSITMLDNYQFPRAVTYLNPLLLRKSQYTRLNAMFSLQNVADRGSIPYLMLALFDPEEQNVVAYSAYRTLHRLIPVLGHPHDGDYFEVEREAETARVLRWWKDELSGKYPQLTLQTSAPIADFATLPLEKLNLLLFEPATEMRQKAMAQLQTRADSSSIPYLMLALYDPDESIAYGAYTKLYQLIPQLKSAKARAFFAAHREQALEAPFDWWNDELLGRHVQAVKPARSSQPKRVPHARLAQHRQSQSKVLHNSPGKLMSLRLAMSATALGGLGLLCVGLRHRSS